MKFKLGDRVRLSGVPDNDYRKNRVGDRGGRVASIFRSTVLVIFDSKYVNWIEEENLEFDSTAKDYIKEL